jgi:superfamily II DNA or RNA helicase
LLPAAAGERLGTNVSRNEMLLNSMRRLPSEWPILLFAVSVDHAQTMAALLSYEGISAAAISAHTDVGARRHYIEEFRRGRLRVLTNFAVLTAGFDAPSVRAIYVARPTYSPVMYQQMIGRGLRGPLNGGKDRCLIANVKDNIERFGEELAFRQFEHLWQPHNATVE